MYVCMYVCMYQFISRTFFLNVLQLQLKCVISSGLSGYSVLSTALVFEPLLIENKKQLIKCKRKI